MRLNQFLVCKPWTPLISRIAPIFNTFWAVVVVEVPVCVVVVDVLVVVVEVPVCVVVEVVVPQAVSKSEIISTNAKKEMNR
jgi:hypothetical protein